VTVGNPIWNIPCLRNRNFTGREKILANLQAQPASRNYTALTQAISGLGGVGKTQLALEYAYRHREDYRIVWWIHSEERATLAADYASLSEQLGLPQKSVADQDEVAEAVKHWLEQHIGWLLIFDNA